MKIFYQKHGRAVNEREPLRIWRCKWGNTRVIRIGLLTHGFIEISWGGN